MLEFDLIGDVGYEITAQQVSEILQNANGEDVTFYIASMGGDLSHGLTIHGTIQKYPGKTKAVLVGNTASAGTVFALGCDEVECNSTAPFLIHATIDPTGGNAKELEQKINQLQKHDKILVSLYKKKTGLSEEAIRGLMDKEDWLLPEEAKEFGFVDKVNESPIRAVAYYTKTNISNELLIKLNKKMNIFGKNKKENKQSFHLLNLEDGAQLVASSDTPEAGVEVAPLGQATLEDGKYTLQDGRVIVIEGGAIVEVMEKEAEKEETLENSSEVLDNFIEATSNAVEEKFKEIEEKIEAKFSSLVNKLKGVSSDHKPAKGTIANQKASVQSVHSIIKAKTDSIRDKIVESRKS